MMNFKIWEVVLITVSTVLSIFSCKDEMTEHEQAKADFPENAKRIEEAMQEVDPDFKSLGYTEVTKISYAIEGGGDIQYYSCKTTYFDEIPELTGVHLQAIHSVIDPDTAENRRKPLTPLHLKGREWEILPKVVPANKKFPTPL